MAAVYLCCICRSAVDRRLLGVEHSKTKTRVSQQELSDRHCFHHFLLTVTVEMQHIEHLQKTHIA